MSDSLYAQKKCPIHWALFFSYQLLFSRQDLHLEFLPSGVQHHDIHVRCETYNIETQIVRDRNYLNIIFGHNQSPLHIKELNFGKRAIPNFNLQIQSSIEG